MIQIIALLYASENGVKGLRVFESQAVPVIRKHGGTLISASFNDHKSACEPDEIHVIQFPKIENFEEKNCLISPHTSLSIRRGL